MSSAMYPNDPNLPPPPPYSVEDQYKTTASYQQQVTPTIYPSNSIATPVQQPTGGPIYVQTRVVYPPVGVLLLGRSPASVPCPQCNRQVLTNVRYETGSGTWIISLLICLFGGIFGCCLIPFCASSCQDAVHTCPLCDIMIGRRSVF